MKFTIEPTCELHGHIHDSISITAHDDDLTTREALGVCVRLLVAYGHHPDVVAKCLADEFCGEAGLEKSREQEAEPLSNHAICCDCADRRAGKFSYLEVGQWQAECEFCGEEKPCCSTRDYRWVGARPVPKEKAK